jgi:leukotriene-A4 hydrolase
LETILGGPDIFEPYLKAHVEMFSHKSITTDDFKDFLFKYFSANPEKIKILSGVDWEVWFHSPGMSMIQNVFDDSLAKTCIELANDWDSSRNSKSYPKNSQDFTSLSSNQKIMFLEKLMEKPIFPIECLKAMNLVYKVSEISNSEIKFRWQMLCLSSNYEAVYSDVITFISSVGRMKFVRPLYRSLFKVQPSLARDTFTKTRQFYHPICSTMIAKDLGV